MYNFMRLLQNERYVAQEEERSRIKFALNPKKKYSYVQLLDIINAPNIAKMKEISKYWGLKKVEKGRSEKN